MSEQKEVQHVLHTVNLNITLKLVNNGVEAIVNGRRSDLRVQNRESEETTEDTNNRALKARYEEHKRDYFDMSKKPKGKVLVINNDFSHDSEHNRTEGSEQDVENLKQAFKQLGGNRHGSQVDFNLLNNLSAEEILEHLRLFVQFAKQTPSFLAIVIMSHGDGEVGGDDIVFGNDGSRCNVSELVALFKSKSEWKKVPVMMFFEMCRGVDKGRCENQDITHVQMYADTVDAMAASYTRTLDSGSIEKKLHYDLLTFLPGCQIVGLNDKAEHLSKHYAGKEPNMLISFACSEGRAAILNPSNGSWFIQELCDAIRKYSTTKDMIEIMREVHENVNRKRSSNFTDIVMACDSAHTFTRKFEFFPGFPEK